MQDRVNESIAHHLLTKRCTRRTAVGAVVASQLLRGTAGAQTPIASPIPEARELPQPSVVKSSGGLFEHTLVATPATVDLGAPMPVTTYTYDETVPGATWEVSPGDTLRIELVNNLPPLDHSGHTDMTRPHEWTTTNLHTHGLHVSPEGKSDNIFVEIAPGDTFDYEIAIPDDHTGGLFWYHPHKHGAVCQQVRGGMAGALVVRGEIDNVPEVAAAKEQIMVLQAIELGDDYQLLDPIPNPTVQEAFFPRSQVLYSVNGTMNPKITMYPGEVQRWRMLNAAEGKFMSLKLAEHDVHVIAWDGLTLSKPDTVDTVMMSAGNRVELLVKAGKPGRYDLILTPGSSQHPDIPGMPMPDASPAAGPAPISSSELKTRPILTVEVNGSGPEMALPAILPAWDPPIREIATTRTFAYTVEREDDNTFLDFGVDGEAFDPARAPYQMKLGTAEEWTLVNGVDNKLPLHAHGFHIHVNPFKVTRINGEILDVPLWRDTFALPGTSGDSFTFEMNIDDFTGKFVNHCHVLAHEDLGMMEAVEVIP